MSGIGTAASGGARIAALLTVALLIVVPAVWVAWSLHAASLAAETVRAQTDLLANLRSRVAALQPASGPGADSASVFLPGETPAIAGAALQQRVADVVEAAGGRVVETEFARVETAEADPGRVDLRVAFDAEIVSLQRIVHELETALPILILRSVDIQSATEATESASPPLRVVMLVSGSWEAAN